MTAPHDRLAEPLREGALDGLHGAVAVRGGETLLEYYGTGQDFTWNIHLGVVEFGPGTLHDIRSISKSITALLYGIALGDGLVPDATAPLLRQFPEYPDLAADPARARLTVEHALTMSLGLQWREDLPYDDPANAEIAMELAPDRYRYVLERPVIEPPGTRWHYCGGAAALLGRLIADGTGQSLAEYGRAALFTPLEIHDVEWMSGPDGVASAASGLRLTPRALARIGELVLARGAWQGRQLVPAGWIDEMLRPRLETTWGGQYGYQWYVETVSGHRLVSGSGNGGQRLFVLPDLDLTVAVTAGNYNGPDQWRTPMTLLERVVLPAVT
ncbi:serine hydrolase [Plantactinospora veratri]|uniref:Serine hydrolase n=1 Tax=Plantactinospora veratri TaxID=1436122 RepID=A0ABU7SCY4_9ACTN